MGRLSKRIILCALNLIMIISLSGCKKKQNADISAYLNNTLEHFIDDTGLAMNLSEDGVYRNEQMQVEVTIKNNIINSIILTGNASGYGMEKVEVGDKKKKVEQIIQDTYTSKPEITDHEDTKTSTYAYQKMNRLFTIEYDSESKVTSLSMEITSYIVGNASENNDPLYSIDKSEIMVTVGDIDVSYSEAMIYLRTAQQIYETEFGNDVWSYDLYGNGTTVGAVLKQEVLNQIIQLEVINMVADEDQLTLSDDEMLEVRQNASDFMKTVSEDDQIKYGITEDLAVQVFATNMMAEKQYEKVTIDVDTDVSDEDAQQSKLYKLFIKTYGSDSKGNRTQLTETELTEIKQRVETLYEQALTTTDFYALAQSNSDDDVIEYVVGRNDLGEEDAKAALSLKDGQVSDIIQNENGYVIWYCEDAYDADATRQVKEKLIEQRRSDLFVQLYTEWYSRYEVKVNVDLWNRLELLPLA